MMQPKTTLASAASKAVPTNGAPTKDWLEAAAFGMANAYLVNTTPAIAAEWLKLNADNRKFRKAHMRTIAEEMRRGEWKLTHQGVAFGTSGRLLDGQHRLTAIVESGTTQPLLVFIDCPEDAFANFDRGAQRGIADVLLKDPKIVSIGGTLVRLCVRGARDFTRKAMPAEVQKVLEVFGPDLIAMNEASAASRVGRTLSSIKAAWLIHHHGASAFDQRLLRDQWKAFAEFNPKRMDESTASGDRRLENFKAVRGGAVEIESACIGWLMFDPARRDLERVVVRHSVTALDELKAAARAIIPDLVPLDVQAIRAKSNAPIDRVVAPKRVTVFSDPVLGPAYRAKAAETIAASKAAAE